MSDLTVLTDQRKNRIRDYAHYSLKDPGLGKAITSLLYDWETLLFRTAEVCTRFIKRVLKQLIWILLVLLLGLILHGSRGVYFEVAPILSSTRLPRWLRLT